MIVIVYNSLRGSVLLSAKCLLGWLTLLAKWAKAQGLRQGELLLMDVQVEKRINLGKKAKRGKGKNGEKICREKKLNSISNGSQ